MTIIDSGFTDLATPSGPMRTFVFRPAAPGKYPGLLAAGGPTETKLRRVIGR
jgi:hypothetical protein